MLYHNPGWPGARLNRLWGIHDSVYACFLVHMVVQAIYSWCSNIGIESPTVPETTNIVAWDNLSKSASLNMTDLDESGVEKQNIW